MDRWIDRWIDGQIKTLIFEPDGERLALRGPRTRDSDRNPEIKQKHYVKKCYDIIMEV